MPGSRKKLPILVMGFEPFGGDDFNPSQEIAHALHGTVVQGRPVVGLTLPCVFRAVAPAIAQALKNLSPSLVVGLGLAASRSEISPERVAINLADARIPDNAGAQPTDRPVVRGGPAAYWSTLPVKAIVAALLAKGIPATVSHTAGTFVCNYAFYYLMHLLQATPRVRGGFIHVPAVKSARFRSGIPMTQQLAAIQVALAVSLQRAPRPKVLGGEIS